MTKKTTRWVLYGLSFGALTNCKQSQERASSSFFDKLNGVNGVSESVQQSEKLKLLIRKLKCDRNTIKVGDSIHFEIKELFFEKGWQCGPNCESVLALNQTPENAQLVMKCTPKSELGNLNIYWFLTMGDPETRFYETGSKGLVAQRIRSDVHFPIKYYILFKKDEKSILIDSITVY